MQLEKVVITLPQGECTQGGLFEGVKADVLKVIDIPGVEDAEFSDKIIKLIKRKRSSILPIFLLNLDTGTADLLEFKKIRELYEGSSEAIDIPVIFTKLNFALKNARNILENEGSLEGKDKEEQRLLVIERTQ